MKRTVLLFFLLFASLLQAQRYNPDVIGRWKVEFQDPPEKEILTAQLRSLNLTHLIARVSLPEDLPLILTISRNKLLIQADNQLFEVYNCTLERENIVILDRQELLSPVPLEYHYNLVGENELILTGTLNKINNIPVTLKLRRVMVIPQFGDGTRGWLTRQGFLDVGKLMSFRGNYLTIAPRGRKPVRMEIGQLDPLDQLSVHEPELVRPDRVQATFELEKERFRNLPYPILTTTEETIEPIYFTKEYFFDENAMDEGYLITIYNTEKGDISFRAHGTGGGTNREGIDIRYMKDRKSQDRMVIWIDDEEIYERPLDEVAAEHAAANGAAPAAPAVPAEPAPTMTDQSTATIVPASTPSDPMDTMMDSAPMNTDDPATDGSTEMEM